MRVGFVVAALLAMTACGPCGKPPRESSAPPAAPSAPAIDPLWLEGKLPPSVLEGTPKDGGTLVVRLASEPPHLSPRFLDPSDLVGVRIVLGNLYETLYRINPADPRYGLLPLAAESVDESPDHLTFTFHLRHGMTFHDGTPVTAHDVDASLAAIMDPTHPSGAARSYYADVKSHRALDDFTFEVSLTKPYFLFFRQIATDLPIAPKKFLEQGDYRKNPMHQAPIGSGPFKLGEWKRGESITLVRNEGYWGPKPHLEKVVFRVVPDHTVATQLFDRGEFDLMTQLQHGTWVDMPKDARAVRDFHRIRFFGKNYSFIAWNEERPLFKDRRVRRALGLLFDHATFNRTVLHDLEKPATCHFLAGSDDCDPNIAPLPYDPEEAKRLLAEAGFRDSDGDGVLEDEKGTKFRFSFLIPASSVFLGKLSVALKESYRKAGIEMDITRADWGVVSQRLDDHYFDASSLSWGGNDAPGDPYQVWHSSQVKDGSNFISYRNPAADALIEKARVEFDEAKRSAMYRELGHILWDDQPYTFLNVKPELDAVRRTVKGVRPSLTWYDFRAMWFEAPAKSP